MSGTAMRAPGSALLLAILSGLVGAVVLGVLAEVTSDLPRGSAVSEAGGPWFALAFVVGAWTRSWRIPVVLTGAVVVTTALAVNIGYRAAVHGPDSVHHFVRDLAPLWFPFAAAVGALFASAGVAVRSRGRWAVACGGGLVVAGLLLDSVVSWQRLGMAGVAVGVLDLTLLAAVGVPLLRRARPWRLAVAALAWALVGATVGIAAYDRVLGGVDQGPDDVTIHAD